MDELAPRRNAQEEMVDYMFDIDVTWTNWHREGMHKRRWSTTCLTLAMLIPVLLLGVVRLATTVPTTPVDEITPREGERCGFDSCTDASPDVLNVHIVAHTHDDVGWLKTVDQYYYGSRNNIQKACVNCILNSVVKELWEDPKRKFIYVETAFFWKWWVAQPASVQARVHTLVRQGRLQFVGGAWSMNDEAAAHYQSTVDQFTWGHSKLNETFGECGRPLVGWQIDPFGHSREFAAELAMMGYHGLFLGRIDFQDKAKRLKDKSMEMLWRGSDDLGQPSDIFTSVLYNTYSPPSGFCFDVLCDDEPIIDDVSSPMYNVDERVTTFLDYVLSQSKRYRSNNVLVTMGGDFTYMDAFMWFDNLDKLIKHANLKAAKEGLNVKLFYSTPTCYLKAVKRANPTLPIKQDDLFPYASDPTAFWTGYFTSRPTTKWMEREGNNYLQTFKMLQVLANLPEQNMFVLNELKSAMGVMQHHDAITGTEKQHVTHDYERLVSQAVDDAVSIGGQAFNKLMRSTVNLSYERCQFNQSQCAVTESSDAFVVTVFNNQGFSKSSKLVELPVVGPNYSVYNAKGIKIQSNIVNINTTTYVDIPTRHSDATHLLSFRAKTLPALGYKNFYVKKDDRKKRNANKKSYEYYANINDYWKDIRDKSEIDVKNVEARLSNFDDSSDVTIVVPKNVPIRDNRMAEERDYDRNINWEVMRNGEENTDEEVSEILQAANRKMAAERVRAGKAKTPSFPNEDEMRMLSDEPRLVQEPTELVLENEHVTLTVSKRTGWMNYSSKSDVTTLSVLPQPVLYTGCVGNNMVPANRSSGAYIFRPNMTSSPHTFGEPVVITGIAQTGAREVTIQYEEIARITISLEKDDLYLRSSINIPEGKEYALRFITDLKTDGVFYTDLNGRQMLKRIRNKRPQWNLTLAEPVPGNYYPITTEVYIEDDDLRVVANVDRARGVTSLKDGQFEIMQHRRLLHDDAFGVGEALNENYKGVGLYMIDNILLRIIPKNKENLVNAARKSLEFFSDLQVFVANADITLNKFKTMRNEYSFLENELPKGLHLLTLEPFKNKILIRFENYLDKDLSPDFISVDLGNLFTTIEIENIKEMSLSANKVLSEIERWEWNTESEFSESFNKEYGGGDVYRATEPKTFGDDGLVIKLKAKEIRTFVAEFKVLN